MRKHRYYGPLGADRRLPSIRRLSLACMAAIGIGQTALAQEPIEEILVTGSRIRQTSGMETPTPVTVVTRQELAVLSRRI